MADTTAKRPFLGCR